MVQIKSVIPRSGFRLEVYLNNGNTIILDFSNRLHTVRFGLLADEAFFQLVATDGDVIKWGNKIEVSASEIFQLQQK